MSSENRKIDEGTLDALLYLSRLSPESTNLETLRQQVDQIVGYFDILSEKNTRAHSLEPCSHSSFSGQPSHLGERAVHISRPKLTIRWQKSDCFSGEISSESILSTLTGSRSSSGYIPNLPHIRIQ